MSPSPDEAGAVHVTTAPSVSTVSYTHLDVYKRQAVTDSSGGFGPKRGAVVGAVLLGLLGSLVGLIRGLSVYPPTAWFALFEVGVPALIVGGLFGAIVGSVLRVLGRFGHSRTNRL